MTLGCWVAYRKRSSCARVEGTHGTDLKVGHYTARLRIKDN
jgi:hypothetical protein